jgi:hypothetical protein
MGIIEIPYLMSLITPNCRSQCRMICGRDKLLRMDGSSGRDMKGNAYGLFIRSGHRIVNKIDNKIPCEFEVGDT